MLIKGRVGTGKSSVLKMLGGLISPQSGGFSNNDSKGSSLKPIFIHSQSEFNFVTGYIRDELMFAGVPEDNFRDILGKSVYDMSGGELKKLSILMALARSGSGVVLLDEPLDMLDDPESLNLSKTIIESSYKQPFIIATHDSHFDDAADVIVTIEKINGE